MNVFDYENKDVIVHCTDGKAYKGHVDWCAKAEDIDEEDDVITVGWMGFLASEIESIEIVDKTA